MTKTQQRKCQEIWLNWGDFLIEMSQHLVNQYADELSSKETEWETTKQSLEYVAKKQALIDLKNILSQQYE